MSVINPKINNGTDNYEDHDGHNGGGISITNRNNKVQLNEIFVSIEGEGILAGTKTLFIRFSGCHLKCHWCDTKYSLSPISGKSKKKASYLVSCH